MRGHAAALFALTLVACTRFGAVYPPRPAPSEAPPSADPPPSRVVAHLAITSKALQAALDAAIPRTGEGTFPLLGGERRYTWERGPVDLDFAQGRIAIHTKVQASVAVPLHPMSFPLDLKVNAEPIVSSEYAVKLQSVDVKVGSGDERLALADKIGGVYEKISDAIGTQVKGFTYDLRPLLSEAAARVAQPIDLPVGDAHACAKLRVLGIEASPTVLADGLEKELALVVAPSVTLPCEEVTGAGATPALPPLANVTTVLPGPFTVTVPIAARYDELTRAMSMAFTDGKLFFSTEYPGLYLEKPELYESDRELVLKLHLQGPVHKFGIDADLDGDLYLAGHPAVVDNELSIPDLEPTIETKNFLLSLKAMSDGDSIRDQARKALRLDIGDRLRPVREKLSSELTFGNANACFQGDVDRIEVTGVHAHASYLRVYVQATARARITAPCPVDPTPATPAGSQ
ncbi:MAG TPA: DUF4403 family protein [Polyangiaceae bacterium]|jgi:hypothetical protein